MRFERVEDFYSVYDEDARLLTDIGKLEFERSREIISRCLPAPPATVVDVGGGTGRYSYWLSARGYKSHLVDLSGVLIEKARAKGNEEGHVPLASCEVGDARKLSFADSSADVALLMGPLYHLTAKDERIQALREAHRVLASGGRMFAAAISRFASTLDGLTSGAMLEETFRQIVGADLSTGQHRNSTTKVEYFTTAFFHLPCELEEEVSAAGFVEAEVIPIEGIAGLLGNLSSYMANAEGRRILLELLRDIEKQPSLRGATLHMLCMARKR